MLFAFPCTVPRAHAFRSCLGLWLNPEGEGSAYKPGKEKGARAPLSLLSLSLEALGGAGQRSDEICFPGDCREQSPAMELLRKEIRRLAAEIDASKEVMLHFGKEGWDGQGPSWATWWAFPAHPTQPSPARGCWSSFSALKPLALAKGPVVISPAPMCLSRKFG